MLDIRSTLIIIGTVYVEVLDESGTSTNVSIADMHYTISEDGLVEEKTYIVNADLYEQNKETVRVEIDEFFTRCREREDIGI